MAGSDGVDWNSDWDALLGTDQDWVIAAGVGRSVAVVAFHRRRLGIKGVGRGRIDWAAIDPAIAAGDRNDQELALAFGVPAATIGARRRRMGRGPSYRRRARVDSEVYELRRLLVRSAYDAGWSLTTIEVAMGIDTKTVHSYVEGTRLALPLTGRPG